MSRLLAVVALVLLFAAGARAANPDEMLADPVLEERARELSKELRCLVCQNQSIDASDADLARDLRLLVRERIQSGDTDDEVLAYLTDRYGAFVRLKPPLTAETVVLWGAPFVVVVIALLAGGLYLRSRRRPDDASEAVPLSAEEEAALAALLAERKER
ncbi:cytochrome c-type biogenesis protein CcmH [Acuticoccus sp. M5D2P5]|uniref:cytochrome c-type biogenesis protein n=1 Tax=Acuticoccus kalidii TaxID=2910977 RepID=UPI001F1602EF|nr:cytochrome c-type biogenesis protein [Acuticoccus kalidii]MCF3935092.1 cytochrome c-type biogenesis protein CcmH [Acuticoccus kalidii]